MRILRCFEPRFYRLNLKKLEDIFEDFADQEEDDEKVISKQGFIVFGNHFKLFDLRSHEKFFEKAANSVELVHRGIREDSGRVENEVEQPETTHNGQVGVFNVRIAPVCDEANLRTVEIFMEGLERDLADFEEFQKDKIWINYNILESYVNDLYVKYE